MTLLKKYLTKFFLATAAVSVSVSAIAAESRTVSRQEAINMILRGNPTLGTLRRAASAENILGKATSQLGGPEIEGSYSFGSGADDKWEFGISQGFDWPGAYRGRRKASDAQSRARMANLAVAEQQVRLDAMMCIIDGVYNTRRLKSLTLLRENLDSVARSIEYGFNHGELTILDVKKVRLELFRLDNDISDCRGALDEAESSLRLLAGDSALSVDLADYDIQPFYSLGEYYTFAENVPAVQAALAQAEANALEAEASRLSRLPSFSLGYRHAFEEGHHFNGISASVGLPSWGRNYEREGNRLLAENSLSQASIATAEAKRAIDSDYAQAERLREMMKKYNSVIFDDEYIELLMLAYHGGQINVITLIQEINFFIEASLEFQTADRDYQRLLARLNINLPERQ